MVKCCHSLMLFFHKLQGIKYLHLPGKWDAILANKTPIPLWTLDPSFWACKTYSTPPFFSMDNFEDSLIKERNYTKEEKITTKWCPKEGPSPNYYNVVSIFPAPKYILSLWTPLLANASATKLASLGIQATGRTPSFITVILQNHGSLTIYNLFVFPNKH